MKHAAVDQAEGLRRMFAADATHMVALVGDDAQDLAAALAIALSGQGRKVLLLDEQLGGGDTHLLATLPVAHDIGAVVCGEKSLQEIVIPVAGITLLPAAVNRVIHGADAARVRLLAGFHALSSLYDVVLVHAAQTTPRRSLGFALAAPEVLVLCDGSSAGITTSYGQIKFMARSPGKRHFRLMFRGVEAMLAKVLFRNLASVCRQHLQMMPDFAGIFPLEQKAAADAMEALASEMAQWPVLERDDSRFEAFMRRLLTATSARRTAPAEH
jgi:flagellar biosynthesis protein FlhG